MAALLLLPRTWSPARPQASIRHASRPSFRSPFFGLFVPHTPYRDCYTPHTEKRSPFVVSLSLHFGACKPIQARLRLRACKQRSCFFGRNSLSGAITQKFSYRLPSLYVLATSYPRNPSKAASFGRDLFSRGFAASVIRLAAVPFGCCARMSALVPASFGRANEHWTPRLCSSYAQSDTQQRSPPRLASLRRSRSPPALGCSQRLEGINHAEFSVLPSPFPKPTHRATTDGLILLIFQFFWFFF